MFVWEWKALGYTIRQNRLFSVYFFYAISQNFIWDFADISSFLAKMTGQKCSKMGAQ